MKKILAGILSLILAAGSAGCSGGTNYTRYRMDFMDTFDTVVTVMAYAPSDADFKALSDTAYASFKKMNDLFDIYHDYPGVANLKTVNDNAGIAPVKVDPLIISLLKKAGEWYAKTDGKLNVTMGPVTEIWRKYREAGLANPDAAAVPPSGELAGAAKLVNMENLVVDEQDSTVFLKEKGMLLDVGAVAKGFATEETARLLKDKGYTSVLISAGGNIRAIGKPLDGRSKWGVGIKDPFSALGASTEAENLLDTALVADTSVVSSGTYERYYKVNGKVYHHLIDPDTLMPADYYVQVTDITPDSGDADILSTTLFLLPLEKSRALAESLHVEALWVLPDGKQEMTPGMKQLLEKAGGAAG
jgi:thiamine biosynthesis lipoprotein